ncbi:MAG: hypothetical protein AVDCRST_MAG56-3547, partial [uncultured Cytophagales bacterium]
SSSFVPTMFSASGGTKFVLYRGRKWDTCFCEKGKRDAWE